MVRKEFEKVNVSEQSYVMLKHVSKVTGLSMTKMLESIIEGMFSLSINYDKATFSCYERVTEDTVYITIHGYGKKLTMGKCNSEAELRKVSFDKINEDLKKKAVGLIE